MQIALTVKGDDLDAVTASAQASVDALCEWYPYGASTITEPEGAAS